MTNARPDTEPNASQTYNSLHNKYTIIIIIIIQDHLVNRFQQLRAKYLQNNYWTRKRIGRGRCDRCKH